MSSVCVSRQRPDTALHTSRKHTQNTQAVRKLTPWPSLGYVARKSNEMGSQFARNGRVDQTGRRVLTERVPQGPARNGPADITRSCNRIGITTRNPSSSSTHHRTSSPSRYPSYNGCTHVRYLLFILYHALLNRPNAVVTSVSSAWPSWYASLSSIPLSDFSK